MSRSFVESVEARRFLSVAAAISGSTLNITGSSGSDSIRVVGSHIPTGTSTGTGGTTSVFLDLPLLKAAANLELTGASSTGTPFNSSFQVGFPITGGGFTYRSGAFAPVSGTIEHSGTVTFNNAITVGNFSIGFDPSRVGGGRSGFTVSDTASGLGVLFDVGAPSGAVATPTRLSLTGADLLVSPEFSIALNSLGLASSNLTGADVGNARIDARAAANFAEGVLVQSAGLPGGQATFTGDRFSNVSINTGGGNDNLSITRVRLTGALTASGGEGADNIAVITSSAGALTVNGNAGNDNIAVVYGRFSSTRIDAGAGNDYLALTGVQTGGNVSILGGDGTDILLAVGSGVRSTSLSSVEAPLIV
jgi:hypothetical protein